MRAAAALLLLAAASFVVASAQEDCTKEHARVGLAVELETFEHDVAGTVVIVDDCSFKVENFTYDGEGEDAFWFAADARENLEAGFIMDEIPSEPRDGTEEVMVTLTDGVTWDDVNVISVWSRSMAADYGSALLEEKEEEEEGEVMEEGEEEEKKEEDEEEEEEGKMDEECGMEHEKFNSTAELEEFQHDVTGTVVVKDDCSFEVLNFKYDGTGPDVFWYVADTRENLEAGFILDAIPSEHGPWDGSEEVVVALPDGVTWDDVNVVSVWCRAFGIDFGSAVFGESEEDKAAARAANMNMDYEGAENKTMDSSP